MGVEATMVTLLMAPNRLPSCFSGEDGGEVVTLGRSRASRPARRLRDLPRAVSRFVGARLAETRKRSAAAW